MTAFLRSDASRSPLSGSSFPDYIRVPLKKPEIKIYEHKLKRINFLFSENELLLNVPELFRVILLNIDDPILSKTLVELYRNDASDLFKGSKK